jgi:carboxyl-terminal processing protease
VRAAGRAAAVGSTLVLLVTAPAPAQSSYELLQTFSGVLNHVRANYVDTVTTQHLVRSAISGMLGALDPHSHFAPRADAERLAAWRAGRLAATGLILEDVDGAITVQSVYPGSPAARAGILPGDRVISINDTLALGQGAATIQARMLGERGTRVRLLLERGPRLEPEAIVLSLRMDFVRPRSVAVARRLAPGVGYVRLEEFLPETAEELERAVERALRGGGGGLILDLRGNPGGIVEVAVDVASLFLAQGQIVFRTRGRHRDLAREFHTRRQGRFRDVPLIVLIDEGTASAAEAVAGSLQDHDRALVAGRRSFGKALMQRAFEVPPHGDLVWLTVGYVLTPSGRLIQRPYRGLTAGQYYQGAGRAPGDTAAEYRTGAGRLVRAGGGIAPDSFLAGPPRPPTWFLAALDRNLEEAVADSVARTLPADAAAQERFVSEAGSWPNQLLEPFLERVRQELGVRAEPDSATAVRIARSLAARAASVRWGPEAEEELRLRTDPDIAAAIRLLGRVRELLTGPR